MIVDGAGNAYVAWIGDGVGTASTGGKIRFTKVVFIYDGKKLKVKKRKPFRHLIDPGPLAPGSVHRVKARVTLILTRGEKEKKIKRVIKGTVKACR